MPPNPTLPLRWSRVRLAVDAVSRTAALAALLATAASGASCRSLAAQELADVFRLDTLAAGVYAAVVVERPSAYAFANSLVVVGDSAALVVDTQQSRPAAAALADHLAEALPVPVAWVVNTHWHGDHVYGNGVYRARWPGVHIAATPATREGMRGPGRERLDEERRSLPATIEERRGWLEAGRLPDGRALTPGLRQQVEASLELRQRYLDDLRTLEQVEPDVLVDAPRRLDLGGRSVVLRPAGPAHTAGDLVVHVPDAGVVAVGDLLEEGAPWIDGADIPGWADALRRLTELHPALVVPSHGGVDREGWLLTGYAELFGDLVAAARAAEGRDDESGVQAVRDAASRHERFLRRLGLSDPERRAAWIETAAEACLAQVRRAPPG